MILGIFDNFSLSALNMAFTVLFKTHQIAKNALNLAKMAVFTPN
jgi:hypothetical protein